MGKVFVGLDWVEDHPDVLVEDEQGRRLAGGRLPEGWRGLPSSTPWSPPSSRSPATWRSPLRLTGAVHWRPGGLGLQGVGGQPAFGRAMPRIPRRWNGGCWPLRSCARSSGQSNPNCCRDSVELLRSKRVLPGDEWLQEVLPSDGAYVRGISRPDGEVQPARPARRLRSLVSSSPVPSGSAPSGGTDRR